MVTVTGSLAYDYLMKFNGEFKDHLINNENSNLSVSFFAESLSKEFGGTAGNIAYSLSLLGIKPVLIGTLGTDHQDYYNHFKKIEIDTDKITIIKNDISASAYIITDNKNNQITSFYGGAMLKADETQIDKNTELAIIAPTEVNTMRKHAKQCIDNNIRFIFDPGQSLPMWDKDSLQKNISKSYITIVNEYEKSMILSKLDCSEKDLIKMCNIFIETKGENGSIIYKDGKEIIIKAIKVENTIDPTGCGDAYRAGLIFGILNGMHIEISCRIGTIISSYVIQYKATQSHFFELENIINRYEEEYKEKLSYFAF